MTTKSKRIVLPAFLLMLLANAIVYLIYHVNYLLANPEPMTYCFAYISEIWGFLMPALTVLVSLKVLCRDNVIKAFGCGALLCLSRLPFYFLQYYIEHLEYSSHFVKSSDAVLLSLITTLGVVLVLLLHVSAMLLISIAIFYISSKRRSGDLKSSLSTELNSSSPVNVFKESSLLLVSICIMQFLWSAGFEIYDTVLFFTKYGSSVTTAEIGYIVWRYIYLIVLMVALYYVLSLAKKRLARKP